MRFRESGRTTARRMSCADVELTEFQAWDGQIFTALKFHEKHGDHYRLSDESLQLIWSFMTAPMVPGLTPLAGCSEDRRNFYYRTGPVWSIQELLSWLPRRTGEPYLRAGLELIAHSARILVEAAEVGEHEGIIAHGGLNPARIMVDLEGQLQIVGYGLPQVSVLNYAAGGASAPLAAVRYSPPERFALAEEDVLSDLYSLTLIGLEWMMGAPVFQGNATHVLGCAMRARGPDCIHRFHEDLPIDLRMCFGRALRADRDARHPTGFDFVDAIEDLLNSPIAIGPSLQDLVQTAVKKWKRVQLLLPNATQPDTVIPTAPQPHQPALLPHSQP